MLTRKQQLNLAAGLSDSIFREFERAVREGRVPEEWDGFEIRQWFYEQFRREWLGTVRKTLSLRTKRGKAYHAARYNRSF